MQLFKFFSSIIWLILLISGFLFAGEAPLSEASEECLSCHEQVHPGIVKQWQESRHALITPKDALQKSKLARRVSSKNIPSGMQNHAVGCFECHGINPEQHADTFEHNGYQIHVVVTPKDCATCHAQEVKEYSDNNMSEAYSILMDNKVYMQLVHSVNDLTVTKENLKKMNHPSLDTDKESCLYCHGTKVKVEGKLSKETDFGEMEFPRLSGWPNQGVGRINPDGSKGSCTSCHSRHDFSIAMARKPATCSECHKGPDVPAYKVYKVSKHGNIYSSQYHNWDFEAVPWVAGRDFTAPTCATCHVSLITDGDGNVVAERTHRFNDRLAWRIFGAPYATAHPKSPDLAKITNKAGLQLTAELDGTPVENYLISAEEQQVRDSKMKQICLSCHSSNWVDNHFAGLEHTIKETNARTRSATMLMQEIWKQGLADPSNMFDEVIERDWTNLWLFYENSNRFTLAMGGGGDYSVFAGGRYQSSVELMRLHEFLKNHSK